MHGHDDLTERITRSLAYMLRHQPEEFDLELDRKGFADIGDVVCALNERLAEPIEEDDVALAIEAGDRPRYEKVKGKIRALYGHSIKVDLGEPDEPPDFLWVGVGSRDAERAEDDGLRAGRRTYLHLALTEKEARESGRRVAPEYAVVKVHAGDAWEEGIDFYDRKSLYLSEEVPAEFLEVGDIQTDGIIRERRGGRGRDGGRDGGRGRGRGPRSDRGRDRDSRDDRPRREEREERPRREEREERPRREERDDRPQRDERPRRDERPKREERVEETVSIDPAPRQASKPKAAEQSSDSDGGFGLGLQGESKPEPRAPKPAPAPEKPARQPKPEPKPEPASAEEDSFGAGL